LINARQHWETMLHSGVESTFQTAAETSGEHEWDALSFMQAQR
jgi:hypothetical protein